MRTRRYTFFVISLDLAIDVAIIDASASSGLLSDEQPPANVRLSRILRGHPGYLIDVMRAYSPNLLPQQVKLRCLRNINKLLRLASLRTSYSTRNGRSTFNPIYSKPAPFHPPFSTTHWLRHPPVRFHADESSSAQFDGMNPRGMVENAVETGAVSAEALFRCVITSRMALVGRKPTLHTLWPASTLPLHTALLRPVPSLLAGSIHPCS